MERHTHTTICFRPRRGLRMNLRVRKVTWPSDMLMLEESNGVVDGRENARRRIEVLFKGAVRKLTLVGSANSAKCLALKVQPEAATTTAPACLTIQQPPTTMYICAHLLARPRRKTTLTLWILSLCFSRDNTSSRSNPIFLRGLQNRSSETLTSRPGCTTTCSTRASTPVCRQRDTKSVSSSH